MPTANFGAETLELDLPPARFFLAFDVRSDNSTADVSFLVETGK